MGTPGMSASHRAPLLLKASRTSASSRFAVVNLVEIPQPPMMSPSANSSTLTAATIAHLVLPGAFAQTALYEPVSGMDNCHPDVRVAASREAVAAVWASRWRSWLARSASV